MAKHKITNGAVVLASASSSRVYLYAPAIVESDDYTQDSVKHAVSAGLLEPIEAKASNATAKK
ncbi:hypothetical protein [Microbacterium luteum]|uniref:hypothetical protein n=1 Tax=Microbacterium luteum TaxID=2782167 RepID=UPI001887C95A|nr:hypothetical protein [Microbacterium luteum]